MYIVVGQWSSVLLSVVNYLVDMRYRLIEKSNIQ